VCAPMLWAQSKTNAAVRLERLWDDVAKQDELDISKQLEDGLRRSKHLVAGG
jgi:hypothetical protein